MCVCSIFFLFFLFACQSFLEAVTREVIAIFNLPSSNLQDLQVLWVQLGLVGSTGMILRGPAMLPTKIQKGSYC